jgi:hypothetical protein
VEEEQELKQQQLHLLVITTATEYYNGTTWTSQSGTMSRSTRQLGSAGTQIAALGFGGRPTSALTEEWTDPSFGTKTITTS